MIIKARYLLLLLLCNLCVSCIAIEPEDYTTLFKCSRKLDKPYGICSHINGRGLSAEFTTRDKDLAMIDSCGANFVRTNIWFEECRDSSGYLTLGHYNQMMESVNQWKKNVLIIASMWNPRNISECDSVFPVIMNQYNEVKFWEIINEAHLVRKRIPGYGPKDYIDILKEGYRLVKKYSPKSKVLFTGVAPKEPIDNKFTDSSFVFGASNYFDIMNLHIYTTMSEPEVLYQYLLKVSKLLKEYDVEKPVWITETGYTSKGVKSVGEDIQASRLARTYLISFALGIDKVFWYKSRSSELAPNDREQYFGIWHKDYTPKPAYFAYQTLTKMCPDKATRPILHRKEDIYFASWKRADGNKVWALWTSENKTIKASLSISKKYEIYNLYGEKVNIVPSNAEISSSVLYIVGAKEVQIRSLN